MLAELLESLSCCSARPGCQDDFEVLTVPRGDDVDVRAQSQPRLLGRHQDKSLEEKSRGQKSHPCPTSNEEEGLLQTVRLAERKLKSGRMTAWQKEFCYPESVRRYYQGRRRNPEAAATILAQALEWREENREILRQERIPIWQTDLRVVSRGQDGVPIIYGCFRYMKALRGETTTHMIEQMAAVLEAANRARRNGATCADNILDCHGFRIADNLNPAPMLALLKMASQPYRGGLRLGLLIDAPSSFGFLWKAAQPLLPEETRNKIRFVTMSQAIELIKEQSGVEAANEVASIMKRNRSTEGASPNDWNRPSEVSHTVDEIQLVRRNDKSLVRQLSRVLSKTLSNISTSFGGSPSPKDSSAPTPTKVALPKQSWFSCCRRRSAAEVVIASEGQKLHVN